MQRDRVWENRRAVGMSKPQVVLDDQAFAEWRHLLEVHPAAGEERMVERGRAAW